MLIHHRGSTEILLYLKSVVALNQVTWSGIKLFKFLLSSRIGVIFSHLTGEEFRYLNQVPKQRGRFKVLYRHVFSWCLRREPGLKGRVEGQVPPWHNARGHLHIRQHCNQLSLQEAQTDRKFSPDCNPALVNGSLKDLFVRQSLEVLQILL